MVLKLASTSLDAVCLTHVLYTLEAAGHWAGTLPVLWSIRHQLRPQMEFASRATDPAAGRAYAARQVHWKFAKAMAMAIAASSWGFCVPEFDLLHFKNCGCAKAGNVAR